MNKTTTPRIAPLGAGDRRWADEFMTAEWGEPTIVSRGRLFDTRTLPGFVAWLEERRIGLATFRIEGELCELTTINALEPGLGAGTALVEAVAEAARAAGCGRLWLITTNDNVRAIRFYQKRGFHLAAVHQDALAESRRLKPSIPEYGMDGIPLRDEIELEMRLTSGDNNPSPGGAASATILGLHHAQITIPKGEEAAGRRFYCEIMGLPEIEKPDSLKGRGGFWLQVGDRQVHVGVEDGVDRRATKAHLAYRVGDAASWRKRLEAAGATVLDSVPIPGCERFECRDPFGNRLEIIQELDG